MTRLERTQNADLWGVRRAQYPLQWLGEHLIQQSILFEGNPDATGLRERFVYDHEPKPLKPQGDTLMAPQVQQAQAQPQAVQSQQTAPVVSATLPQGFQQSAAPTTQVNNGVSYDTQIQSQNAYVPPDPPSSAAHGMNGAVDSSGTLATPVQQPTTQDTEMTNAP